MRFRTIAAAFPAALLAAIELAALSSPAMAGEITINFLNVMPEG